MKPFDRMTRVASTLLTFMSRVNAKVRNRLFEIISQWFTHVTTLREKIFLSEVINSFWNFLRKCSSFLSSNIWRKQIINALYRGTVQYSHSTVVVQKLTTQKLTHFTEFLDIRKIGKIWKNWWTCKSTFFA